MRVFGILALAAAASNAGAVQAAVFDSGLAAPQITQSVSYFNEYGTPSAQYSADFGAQSVLGAQSSVGGTPGASVFAAAPFSLFGQPNHGAAGYASLNYQAELLGPDNIVVPLTIGYHAFAHSGSQSWGSTALASLTLLSSEVQISSTKGVGYHYCGTFGVEVACNGVLHDSTTTNTPIYISLIAQALNGNAFADPLFAIDPAWAAANPQLASQLSFQFSPGVINGYGAVPAVTGVPEPATWATLIGGFGMVGGTLRRRRRSPIFTPDRVRR